MRKAQMVLLSFRVTNFRSVRDSGWIDAGDVSALIGTNESGKTNLLIPLWKLHPAKNGEIKLMADAPRKDFNTYRQMKPKPIFIAARFEMSDALAREVASLAKASTESVKRVEISRNFDGEYYITFPDAVPSKTISKNDVEGALKAARDELNGLSEVDAADTTLKAASLASIDNALTELGEEAQLIIGPEAVKSLRASKNTP